MSRIMREFATLPAMTLASRPTIASAGTQSAALLHPLYLGRRFMIISTLAGWPQVAWNSRRHQPGKNE
jgi:hypothetical protein